MYYESKRFGLVLVEDYWEREGKQVQIPILGVEKEHITYYMVIFKEMVTLYLIKTYYMNSF